VEPGDDHLRGRLASQQLTAPMVLEGAMSGELFRAYVEQCLVPALERGDVVVMDNFAAHKVSGVQEAIEKAGATLHYLTKYSPDLKPIELPYSKFKDHLRKAAERTVRGLYLTIRAFVPQLGARECANHFIRNANMCFHMSGNRLSSRHGATSRSCCRGSVSATNVCVRARFSGFAHERR
jgi:transposase